MNKCSMCGNRTSYDNLVCDDCRADNYENDDMDEDDYKERMEEQKEEENAERALMCKCGAWTFGKDGKVYHVADCYCGAE